MKIKNVIAMGAAVVLVAGSTLNVSAAEKLSSADLNALKESGEISLIIDVDAYKAAYGDLKDIYRALPYRRHLRRQDKGSII